MTQQVKDDNIAQSLAEALREVFGENEASRRFIDVSRIPLICKSITDIHENIAEIKDMIKENRNLYVNQDQFNPVRNLAYGAAGLILTGAVVALLALIYK